MRRLVVVVTSLALAALAAGAEGAPRKPVLRLADASPLTLKGAYFRPRERVRVTVTAPRRASRVTRASRAGSFAVVFATVPARDPCNLDAVAAGARSGPVALVLPQRMCPPALRP